MAEKPDISLAYVQKWMQQSLLYPQTVLPNGSREGAGFVGLIKDSARLNAREHLAIYQRSYIARLRDCMAKQFSALEYALGKDLFRGFADEYLQQRPATNYNLITLGEKFAAYLEATRPDKNEPVKEDWPDFMVELARFEYAINIIFEEQAEENISLATDTTPEDALQLIPVFHLFDFKFPVRRYYHSFVNKEEPELPMPDKSFCAVTRHNYKLNIHDVNPGQYLFLQYLLEGNTILQAKEKLLGQHVSDPGQLEKFWPVWKAKWIQAGFFMSLQ